MCPGQRLGKVLLAALLIMLCHRVSAQVVAGISVNGRIIARGDTVNVCQGNALTFRSVGQGSVNIDWRFDGGSFTKASGVGPFTVTYNVVGYDTVSQKISAGIEADSMYCIVRVSNTKPVAAFSWTPDGDCGNNPVQFTNLSTGDTLSYGWDFGDGGSSSEASPSHPFLNAVGISGTSSYSVVMAVQNSAGCNAAVSHTVTVKNTPDASIGSADASVQLSTFNGNATFRRCSNIPSYSFSFTNQSTTTSINKGYTIQWGDGSPDSVFSSWAAGVVVTHTFPLGSTTMVVKVAGASGCTGIKSYTVFLGSTPAGGLSSLGNTDICASDSLRFAINNVSGNPPGTLYTFLINDGSVSQVFSHPPPATVGHYFSTGSCSFSSSSGNSVFNNAFGAYLTIENPCGTTSPSVVPIYVSGKPQAGIFVYPAPVVCMNTDVQLENISTYGATITPTGGTGSTCTNSGTQVWTLSPSTGYTVVSGSMGSLNGNPGNGALWTGGTTNVHVSFTKAGTYIAKVYIYNNRCGMDSTTYTICVRNPPQASFTMPARSHCGAGVLQLTNTSPVGGCSGDLYDWKVVYSDPLGCGSNVKTPYSFTGGTGADSYSPALQLNAPGKYVIQLTVTASYAGIACSGAVYTDSILVSGTPKVSVLVPAAICAGSSYTPAVEVDSCYASGPFGYQWQFGGGTPATGNVLNPGPVVYAGTGNYAISLTLTDNVCGTTVKAAAALTVADAPVASAGADRSVCSGEQVKLGMQATGASGLIYRWRPSVGLSDSTVADPVLTASYTGPSADTTITYTVEASLAGSCTSTDQVLVTIRHRPVLLLTPSAAAICVGDSVVLTASGANSYAWAPAVYRSQNNGALVTVRPSVTTLYTVIGNSAAGCADTATLSVVVHADAKALFTATSTTVCSSASLGDLIKVSTDTANGQYSWWDNGVLIGSNTSGVFPDWSITVPGRADTIKLVAMSAYGCKTDSMQQVFHSVPAVNAHFSKNTASGCGPLSVVFTNDSNPADGAQFFWDFGNGQGAVIAQPSAVVFASSPLHRDTTYRITLKAYNGCDTTVWKDSVTVYPDPRAAFSVSGVLGCSPFPLTLYNLSEGGNTSFHWDFGDGESQTTSSLADIVHTYHSGTIDTFTITLQATNRCGVHSDSLDVVVTPSSIRPVIQVSGNALAGCAPFTAKFINNSSGAAQISIDFYDGSATTIVPGNQSLITHQFLQAGVYTVRMRLSNGCTDTSISRSVTVYASPVPAFTLAPPVVCTGSSVAANNLSTNGNSYSWDWGDSSGSDAVNPSHVYAQAGSYQVSLKASLLNDYGVVCSVSSDPQTVRVVDLIKARIDTGVTKPCLPYVMTVTAKDVADAGSVSWTFYDDTRAGGSFQASGATASYQYNSPGQYRVMLVVQNAAGCADSSIHSFTVSATPALKATGFGNLYTCNMDTTVRLTAAVAYSGGDVLAWSWDINGEAAGAGNPFEYRFTAAADNQTAASYSIRVRVLNSSGCADTAEMGVLTIRPLPPPAIQIRPDSILYQPDYTFSFADTSTRISAVRYQWDPGDRNGWSYGQEMVHTYGDTGTYYVKLQVSDEVTGCVRGDTVHVKILHVPGYLYVPDAICPGCAVAELRNFLPKGRGLQEYRLRIYNSWGQQVFETTKLDADGAPSEPWNARSNGQPVQQAAYRWQIEARYINGTEWRGMSYPNHGSPVKSGFITVVR